MDNIFFKPVRFLTVKAKGGLVELLYAKSV